MFGSLISAVFGKKDNIGDIEAPASSQDEFLPFLDKDEIAAVLCIDYLQRKAKSWPLVALSSIPPQCEREILPGIYYVKAPHSKRQPLLQTDANSVRAELYRRYPKLEEIMSLSPDLLVAGGAITSVITQQTHYGSDADIFFHSMSTDEASSLVCSILELFNGTKAKIFRSKYVITIRVGGVYGRGPKYQIIQRLYGSAAEVLGGFDIPACSVGFDGHRVLATTAGAWSLANQIILVDLSRRSTSFESRINKYNSRGFKLVFPGLAIPDRLVDWPLGYGWRHRYQNPGVPFRAFSLLPSAKNEWEVELNYRSPRDNSPLDRSRTERDYVDDGWGGFDMYIGSVTAAARGEDSKINMEFELREDGSALDCINKPNIPIGGVSYAFQHIGKRLRLDTIAKWYLKEDALQLSIGVLEDDEDQVIAIRDRCIVETQERLRQFVQDMTGQLHWVTENPGRQGALHTGSFNPLSGTPADFYGGAKFSQPLNILLSDDQYVTFRSLRRNSPLWKLLPADVFRLIIDMFIEGTALCRLNPKF